MLGRKPPPAPEVVEQKRGFDAYELQMGDIMRGERATLGKSLLDVQRDLKIKAAYIAAVENADPSVFESAGFIAGYVRSYARYLGLDPEWAFERFCAESGFTGVEGLSGISAKLPPKPGAVKERAFGEEAILKPVAPYVPSGESIFDRIEPGAIGSLSVIVALIGALGYGGWTVLQEVQRVQFAPVEQSPGVVANIAPALDGIGGALSGGAQIADTQRPMPDALETLYRPQALDTPVLVPRDGPIAAIDPQDYGAFNRPAGALLNDALETELATNALVEEFGEFEGPEVQVLAEAPPEVALFAVRPAWVRVAAADGTILFEKILDAGEQYILPELDAAPILRAGNSGSLYFSVQGRTFGPAGPGTAVAKNVALSVDAIEANYAQADLDADPLLAEVLTAMAEVGTFGEELVAPTPRP